LGSKVRLGNARPDARDRRTRLLPERTRHGMAGTSFDFPARRAGVREKARVPRRANTLDSSGYVLLGRRREKQGEGRGVGDPPRRWAFRRRSTSITQLV